MQTRLPALEEMLGEDSYRLEGVSDWETVSQLGDANLARLEALVEKHIYGLMAQGETPQELKALAQGKKHLIQLRKEHTEVKPYLPRLRNELFQTGDLLMLYLGDTSSSKTLTWRKVKVMNVEKGHNSQWSMDSSARGYYWRVTVNADDNTPLLPGHTTLSFSTTEPRAILHSEFKYLLDAQANDPAFFDVFCDNAQRNWTPIWCLELGLDCPTDKMNMRHWLSSYLEVDTNVRSTTR
jgi:hypothetical protein